MNLTTNYLKQVYVFSIVGLILSLFLGFGLIFTIPCLIQTLNIKLNYIKYDKIVLDKCFLFCFSGIAMSIINIIVFLYYIPNVG